MQKAAHQRHRKVCLTEPRGRAWLAWSPSLLRNPLTGRDPLCPVYEDTRSRTVYYCLVRLRALSGKQTIDERCWVQVLLRANLKDPGPPSGTSLVLLSRLCSGKIEDIAFCCCVLPAVRFRALFPLHSGALFFLWRFSALTFFPDTWLGV